MRWFQATGMSAGVETGGEPVVEIGAIHVVLDVFLARPDDFHRSIDLFGDGTAWAMKSTSSRRPKPPPRM